MAVTINGSTGVQLGDNDKQKFGTGDDLEIYSDGTNAFIKCPDTGNNLTVESDQHLYIKTGDSEDAIKCVNDGAVELYHNGVKKCETHADGLHIGDGGNLDMPSDSSKIVLGAGDDLEIHHDGSNSYIENKTGNLSSWSTGNFEWKLNTGATHAKFIGGGACELNYQGSKKFETADVGATITNSTSSAQLRILGGSSDGYATLQLTADAGADHEDNWNVQVTPDHYWQVQNKTSGSWATRLRMTHTGTLTATDTSIGSISDSRLKKNTADFTYDLTKFKQFKPKTYEWINTSKGEHQTGTRRGFLAQDIETVDPAYVLDYKLESPEEIALVESNGIAKAATLGTNDAMYISVIQQLITKIETLETKVAALEAHTHE